MKSRRRKIALILTFALFGLIGPLILWSSPIWVPYDNMPSWPLFLLVTADLLWPILGFTECPNICAAIGNVALFGALGLALSQLRWLRRVTRWFYFVFAAVSIGRLIFITIIWEDGKIPFYHPFVLAFVAGGLISHIPFWAVYRFDRNAPAEQRPVQPLYSE